MHNNTRRNRLVAIIGLCACVAALGGLALAGPAPDSVTLAVPGIPTNVQASHDQTDKIEVTWDPVPGATNYQVLRAESEFGTYALAHDEVVLGPPWQDLWALSEQGYWYKVRACDVTGCGSRSEAASGYRNGPPLPPTNLVASDGVTTDTITLMWDVCADTINYEIRRNTVNDPDGAWAVVRVSSPPYEDSLTDPDTTYWYWVVARNAHGDSRYSEPDRGYCGDEPPDWQITATPTRTATRYATATEAPPTGTPTPTATTSPTPTSGMVTATPSVTPGWQTATPTPTLTSSTATPSRTPTFDVTVRVALPMVHK